MLQSIELLTNREGRRELLRSSQEVKGWQSIMGVVPQKKVEFGTYLVPFRITQKNSGKGLSPTRCFFHVDWSGREDLNLRHPAPKAGALPDCATPRRKTAEIVKIENTK
jgi:hypothetical protein